MGIKEQITTFLKEGELYWKQGLLKEARAKYEKARDVIEKNDAIKNKKTLLDGIGRKIKLLDKDLKKVEQAEELPEQSAQVQDLIKKLFAFPGSGNQDPDNAALEGVLALVKFGQYERAILEFEGLLTTSSIRVVAAKNLIRCHDTLGTVEQAIAKYHEWESGELFAADELKKVRLFFESILKKRGIDKAALKDPSLAQAKVESPAEEPLLSADDSLDALQMAAEQEDLEVPDINSVGITLADGPRKGQMVELEVSFQMGNAISLILSKDEKELIDSLQVGQKLENTQFYSPIAFFLAAAVISAKTVISSGPKQGDYSVDLRIVP